MSANDGVEGILLNTRFILAVAQKARHVAAHVAFTESLPDPKYEVEWTKMIQDWEADNTKPCPYANVKTRKFCYSCMYESY